MKKILFLASLFSLGAVGMTVYPGAGGSGGGGTTSPLTTKGDVYGYSTTNARLGVGSDGQVLQADSGQALGVKWSTVAGTGDALVANPLSQFAATTSLQLKGVLSDETGTGAACFATSPTLVTPILGTPTSATLTNATGLPIAGITGLGTGVDTFLATPTSANLITAVTNETGTGSLVFATSPTLVTPALGTPSALVGTNITGTAAGLTAGNVTTNANSTGDVTSVGNATTVVTVGAKTAAAVATSVDDTIAATTSNTNSTIVKRNGSGNFTASAISANRLEASRSIAATAGGTSSLSATAQQTYIFTGTLGQTVKMPDGSLFGSGKEGLYWIVNESTQSLTLQDFSAGALGSIPPNTTAMVRITANSTPGTWDVTFIANTNVAQTFTNKTMSGSSNTFTNLPAAGISGVIPIANLATGTPDGTKFIRDDGTLAAPTASASLTTTYIGYGNGSNALTGTSDLTYDTTNKIMKITGGAGTTKLHMVDTDSGTTSTDGFFIEQDGANVDFKQQEASAFMNFYAGGNLRAQIGSSETKIQSPNTSYKIGINNNRTEIQGAKVTLGNNQNDDVYTYLGNSALGLGSAASSTNVSGINSGFSSIYYMDATSGARSWTVPAASSNSYRLQYIQKVDTSTNAVTASGTIDGITNRVLNIPNQSLLIHSDATGWHTLGEYVPVVGATKPTCDVNLRGRSWTTPGGAGVADILQFCLKDAADVYAWVTK